MRQTENYGASEGRKLVRYLTDNGQYIFSIEQAHAAAEKLGIPKSYESVLLTSLFQGKWVQRLRRGLYSIADVSIHPFAIATRLVEPSAISHWSALNHHGLTEQIPQAVFAITPTKVVTPSMRSSSSARPAERHAWEVGAARYHYMTVKHEYFFGIDPVWVSEQFRIPMTNKERTVLETFASPRLFGGIGEALSVVEQHADKLDIKQLVDYARRYGKASVAKRLGWALGRAGISEKTLVPLRNIPLTGIAILDPTRPRRGPINSRWQILENLAGRVV
ncbi:MAG: hypothetical protein WC859_07210 [Elusimicrobiota bacterium]|jgi:predicted transcriptional regulator of viral defense system